jgi:hypothetical protein
VRGGEEVRANAYLGALPAQAVQVSMMEPLWQLLRQRGMVVVLWFWLDE